MYARHRSVSDTSVVTASPIAPRRSERLLALRTKSKDTNTAILKAAKEEEIGESSKTPVKGKKVDSNSTTAKVHDKQLTPKRTAKKSQSDSDLTPRQAKRRRTGSPEDKQDLPKDKIQRTSSRTTAANQLQSSSKKAKSSVSEPLLTSPKGKTFGGQDKGKKTSSYKESKPLRKGKSSASSSGVRTRQLRKLKGRANMSSDE